MTPAPTVPYNLSFTGASLRPELARIVAEHYLAAGDWTAARAQVLGTNALQCRSAKSARVLETELRQRVSTLTDRQLALLAHGTDADQRAMAWLAASKRIRFAFDFAVEVLQDKLDLHDPVLRNSDYESFVEARLPDHPELGTLTAASRAKIRQVLLKMLAEAGLLSSRGRDRQIFRPVLTPAQVDVIQSDTTRWLAAFLYPQAEIKLL